MILITGCAGFIGFHTAQALLAQGHEVIGVDNMNDYYDVSLKNLRLEQLLPHKNFTFIKSDIAGELAEITPYQNRITHIIHLAAQAGVRYSVTHPFAYGQSNLMGHLRMLELARACPNLVHFLYASSSSVYGNRAAEALSINDRTDKPVSLYAATKKAGELMSESYAHLYALPATGLRFFTVYGPYGRPDMAYFSFSEAIMARTPITVFAEGKLRRDFTYINDIVAGILALMPLPPQSHRILNLGNHKPESVNTMIDVLERNLGQKAIIEYKPREPSDVEETFADISETTKICGFKPTTSLNEGLTLFTNWFKVYKGA